MKLSELKRAPKNGELWTAPLADLQGREDYKITVRGPKDLVSRMLAKADLQVVIDADIKPEAARKQAQELLAKHLSSAQGRFADDGDAVFKKPQAEPSAKNSVVVSFRRTRGEGTFWSVFIPVLAVPLRANLFFVMPPAFACIGSVFPLTGDPDLFLTLNGAFTPTVSASVRGGLAVDTVSFAAGLPFPFPFVPFFRVNGFRASTTGLLLTTF